MNRFAVMTLREQAYTVEQFEQYALLPENQERRLEYLGGQIIEVVSNNYSSKIAANILAEIRMFIKSKGLGDVTGADGGYAVFGERYIPDVAFISRRRQPHPSHATWNPLAPDLAVEVLSPTDNDEDVAVKIANYLAAGTTVWRVNPLEQRVAIFTPQQPVQHLSAADTLHGGGFLPGFAAPLRDIFEA